MVSRQAILRVARPTDNLGQITRMYSEGLGFDIIGSFCDHQGFDGVLVGHAHHHYHLEFTHHHGSSVGVRLPKTIFWCSIFRIISSG